MMLTLFAVGKKASLKYLFLNYVNFIKNNSTKLLCIFFFYFIATMFISLTNYPYIDDIGRQLIGYSGFSEHYSRFLSEYSSRLIQGSSHLTDLGFTTSFISSILLSLISITVIYLFSNSNETTWLTAICSVCLGLNPWFLEALSFRFDSPYIVLSIFVSVFPLIFWYGNSFSYFSCSMFGIFLMCNSYQASSGIFIVLVLTIFMLEIRKDFSLDSLKKLLISSLSYLAGMGLYYLQLKIHPPIFNDSIKMSDVNELLGNSIKNIGDYITNIYNQSATIWVILFYFILVLFFINYLQVFKFNFITFLPMLVIYVILCTVLSYGSYIFLKQSYSLLRPRYEYGFGFFVAIMLISLTLLDSRKIIKKVVMLVSYLFSFYIISFSFVYSSSLNQQKEVFNSQSIILSQSLNKLVDVNNRVVFVNRFLKNSAILDNSSLNYPLLKSLIMPNTNVSWDNTMRFNELTKLSLDFKLFDEGSIIFEEKDLLDDTLIYKIYSFENNIYVIMK